MPVDLESATAQAGCVALVINSFNELQFAHRRKSFVLQVRKWQEEEEEEERGGEGGEGTREEREGGIWMKHFNF